MNLWKKILCIGVGAMATMSPCAAHAAWDIVDAFDLSPFVPLVLDAFMTVATATYDYFVGNGTGIIYILIWGFLIFFVSLYLVKMYVPQKWVSFFGFSGGGQVWNNKADATTTVKSVLAPCFRALIAATLLLQIRPVLVTEYLVNPFLEFGALYTRAITESTNSSTHAPDMECPPDILASGWISERSCKFMTQPVADLSHANNAMIKRGFQYVERGLGGIYSMFLHGGQGFMDIVTGILLIVAFAGCNLFMALLIIQAIFDLGMSLILYPFSVLTWVVKPKNADRWFDVWPAFSGITKALHELIVTMIACAFILTINLAVIRALFQANNSTYNVAAGGSATSNLPSSTAHAMSFGEHSLTWLSAILTFYLMQRIFNLTRERIKSYAPGKDGLYNNVRNDMNITWQKVKATPDTIKSVRETAGTLKQGAVNAKNSVKNAGIWIRSKLHK